MKRILFIGLLITIFSCQNETSNELDKEIEVINDIFLQLPEYIHFYNFSLPIPPPPPPIYNEKGEFVGIDTVAQLEILDKIEKEFNARNIDTSKIVLAVFDTLVNNDHFKLTDSYAVDTIFNNYHSITKSIIENEKAILRLELTDIVETGKYELKSYSEFSSGREIFSEKYDFNFSGVITLSRVYFNKRNNKALIFCDYWCGIDCWTGNALFLEKIDGKWIIVNSELLWIA